VVSVARRLTTGSGATNSRRLGMEVQPVTTTTTKPANRMKLTREWVVMPTKAYQKPTPLLVYPALVVEEA
jgi:hypothetical protein